MKTASLHPGGINTNLSRHTGVWGTIVFMATKFWELKSNAGSGGVTMKSPEVGASTTVTCATLPDDKLVNGGYYDDCEEVTPSESARNEDDTKALFDFCDEATKEFQ